GISCKQHLAFLLETESSVRLAVTTDIGWLPLPFQPWPKGILLLDSCLAPKRCVRRDPCNRPNASDLHDDRFGVQLKASIAGSCNAGLRTRRAALGNSNHRGILASLRGAAV